MNRGESSSRKNKSPVSNENNENEEIVISSDEEQITRNNKKLKLSTTQKNTKLFSEIWEYYEKGLQKSNGHYEAICFYCKTKWSRGKPQKMEAHLATECIQCPEEISRYCIANRQTNYTRNNKSLPFSQPPNSTQTQITDHYKSSDQSLPKFVVDRLDKKVLKTWIMAGIPFNVIKNPFVTDLFKDLNPGYSPPSRTILSDRLVTEEYTRVGLAIDRDLEQSEHLTLALDGWSTSKMESIYNYIVTTDTRMEYLIGLYDYSSESHTSEFLTEEISKIIEKLDTHAINLIASDLVKLEPIIKFINECSKINQYFSTSHASNALLKQGFTNMKIQGGGLQTWIKTRWGSLFMTTDALLRAQPILREHATSITNKANEATLSDCFIHLIKLAYAIYQLPSTNIFKPFAINIFNCRFEEFLHPLYILAYYLHPYYRGKGLKDDAFHKVALAAIEIWQSLGHTRKESEELIAQLRRFELRLASFDLPYSPGLESPKRINLTLKKLEAIAKIRSYYMNNFQRELSYVSKNLTESELRESINISSVSNIISLDDDDDIGNIDGNNLNLTLPSSNTELAIRNIVDLTAIDGINEEMGSNIIPAQEQPLDPADLNYDPNDILNGFLEHERNLTEIPENHEP
ncbi:ribonuclease H-like domain-containing protein [Rhizophagus clarus]|uniref:Ribonuclease H-like domain-containing protein n=1 Tax=Rhizophagus clarus TaxID=94130 RepID=A0A8H3LZG5_9GLOM|nr:ribonuclease H-like domain-containing protein [Rhizophagus clarus]